MRTTILAASFAALCTTVSAASAMPIAPAPAGVEIVKPVYYGYGYRHGYYYSPYHYHYGYYPHSYYRYGYYGHPYWHRYWY